MIWIIHYILFNAGLASVLCLKSVFLKHYCQETTISEIGILLMALPFISTFVKPICCALADRHRAHKACLILSLLIVGVCYGALTIPCFFEDFMRENARLVWYIYIALIVTGYSAFGVVFCLADSLSLNMAIQRGISWGYFRIWAVISWGVCGSIVGTFNETPLLPKYTPGFLVLFGACLIEIVVIFLWPNRDFAMDSDDLIKASSAGDGGGHGFGSGGTADSCANVTAGINSGGAPNAICNQQQLTQQQLQQQQQQQQDNKDSESSNNSKFEQSFASSQHEKHSTTFTELHGHRGSFDSSGTLGKGSTARLNPRLLAAVANMVVEEVGSNLKSSLRLSSASARGRQRTGLSDLIGAEALANIRSSNKQNQSTTTTTTTTSTPTPTPLSHQHQQPQQQQLASSPTISSHTSTTINENQCDSSMTGTSQQQGGGSSILHNIDEQTGQAASVASSTKPSGGLAGTIGRAALRRTQLGLNRMNSLSSASGIAIFDDLQREALHHQSQLAANNLSSTNQLDGDTNSVNSSSLHFASAASPGGCDNLLMNTLKQHHINQNHKGSLTRASGKLIMSTQQALASTPTDDSSQNTNQTQINNLDDKTTISIDLNNHHQLHHQSSISLEKQQQQQSNNQFGDLIDERKIGQDLQLVLLKIILKRNTATLKYLGMFVVMGILMYTHVTYFFMHAEQLAHRTGFDFSQIAGIYLLAHAFSEVISFIIIAQFYMPRVGRTGSIMTAALACAIRFGYYGTYFKDYSLYYAIITETVHGIGYGIIYTLMSDFARETVDHVDQYLPELISLGLVDPRMNPIYLKLPLRATMQGIFSGAFDGLGNGVGVLAGGLYLEHHDYVGMWLWCFYLAIALFVIYPLTEWRTWPILRRNRR